MPPGLPPLLPGMPKTKPSDPNKSGKPSKPIATPNELPPAAPQPELIEKPKPHTQQEAFEQASLSHKAQPKPEDTPKELWDKIGIVLAALVVLGLLLFILIKLL